MKNSIKILVIGILFFLSGCSNMKYLPEGELLYTGGSVKVKDSLMPKKERKALEKELEDLLRPKPNKKFLGLRPKLYIYNIAGEPKKEKGLRNWLRNKVGEPPVLFSKVDLDFNADLIQNYAQNKGYFKAISSADSTRTGKKATADYEITAGPRYKIRSVTFPKDSTQLDSAVAETADKSLLKINDGYDLAVIKAERERIDARLKEKGYYFFNADFLKAQVDSTVGKHEVDIFVKVKPETPDQAKKVYRINDIFIYPSFTVRRDTVGIDSTDVTYYNDFVIIDKQKLFKPRIFDRTMYFHSGDIYNRTDHNLSLNRLVNLGVFKFVKNQFRVLEDDENLLDAFYYLTPLPKKSLRAEIIGKTNSANFTGTELNVNWSHRNAFKGAELFQIKAYGGFEVQVSGQNRGYNVYRVGAETSLTWPRFITPFTVETSSGYMPRTKATLGYEYLMRQNLYKLNSFRASFGYLWKENIRKEHQYNVTEITYVKPGDISAEYQNEIDTNDPTGTKARIVEPQLIIGPTYSYTYTNTMQTEKKHTVYFKGGLDVAGTLIGLASGADGNGAPKELLGVPFSQYVRLEADFRHYLKLTDKSQLASRITGGVGFAYGNFSQMPYIKQFFIGGTNSIRAFRARSLGPGSYRDQDITADSFLPDQTADIKIELNTEYRTEIYSVVKGAVFVDAGNIWLRKADPNRPGADFSSKFLNDFAVGTGAGLRIDLSFLVLRLDLAFPLRKPWLPEGQKWVIDDIDFGRPGWRKENLIFNLAIGYPF